LKKKPSRVAHADTPLPFSLVSDLSPSHMAEEPVAIITDSALSVWPLLSSPVKNQQP
jgi:hypothetical protein